MLDRRIMEQYNRYVFSSTNKYKDLDISFIKEIKWVSDYIEQKMISYYGEDVYLIDHYVNIQKPGHISYKRNNENLNDIRNSCDFTALYIVTGEGNLFLEYDNNIRKQQTFVERVKEKSIAIFNSDINYFLDENKTEYNRIIINFLYKKQ